jgi:hypothetical protein
LCNVIVRIWMDYTIMRLVYAVSGDARLARSRARLICGQVMHYVSYFTAYAAGASPSPTWISPTLNLVHPCLC